MGDALRLDRIGQGARHDLLAGHLGEGLRAVFAGDDEVVHADDDGRKVALASGGSFGPADRGRISDGMAQRTVKLPSDYVETRTAKSR